MTTKLTPVPNHQPTEGADDPLDLNRLRLSQDFLETAGVKKLLVTVPVRKPGKQEFFRVHPDEAFRMPLAGIDLKDDADRNFYLLSPEIAAGLPDEHVFAVLYTAMTRGGVLFLWPCRLAGADGRENDWWRSEHKAAAIAMKRWIRIRADMQLGGYQVFEAASTIKEPEWPSDHDYQSIIRIAFRDKVISNLDHPVLKRLRGE